MGTPHPLSGSSLANLIRVVRRHGHEIEPDHMFRLARIAAAVVAATPLRVLESLRHNRSIRKQSIDPSPVMVLGHWRSGTTHMQNLLLCDEQFATVSLLHCSVPHLHLTFGKMLAQLIGSRLGSQRPMDNVRLGIHEPMSEDFGLVGCSEMTHYHSYFFPKIAEAEFRRTVLFETSSESVHKWKQDYSRLLQRVTYAAAGKRLCLKNPPNTGRLLHLLQLLPDARFVFVRRNPYVIHASTCRLMEKFLQQFALQRWKLHEIESFVSRRFELLMQRWFNDRSLVPTSNLVEVRHEDVVREPVTLMQGIYDKLGVPGFEQTRSSLQELATRTSTYKKNMYSFESEYLERIEPFVGPVARAWGYSAPQANVRRAG